MHIRWLPLKKVLIGSAAVACLAVVLSSVERLLRKPGRESGAVGFKRVLLEQISEADRIMVAEHANPMDGPEGVNPRHDYRAVELDAAQAERLKEMVAGTPAEEKKWIAACFIPHHAIRFSKNGRQTVELKICLECSGLRMDLTHAGEPADLFPKVKDFLAELGFEGAGHEVWNERSVAGLERNGVDHPKH